MGRTERAVGYVRVSTEEQADGHSLDAQRREIARHCERHGYELVRIYADEGVSAHTEKIEKRPMLAALLDASSRREFDVVVVHTIDRWARNVGVQRQALQYLGQFNVGFASVTENIDFTTPAGKLMLTMIGGVSEFFSDQLAVHVSKAFRERAENGLPPGPVPFGYVAPSPGAIPGVVPGEGEAVAEVFRQRAQGESYGAIARWLNAEGFETRGHNPVFTSFAVKDMLANVFYRGAVLYKGTEFAGAHEALVDDDLFRQVQAKRGVRRQRRLVVGGRGILQGRVSCGHCGRALQSDRDHRGRPMYRERHGERCSTNNRSLMAAGVDEQLGAIWKSVQFSTDWRDRMAEILSAGYDGPSAEDLAENRRRIARAYADGGLNETEYEVRLAAIDKRARDVLRPSGPAFDEAAELFSDMPALWERAAPEERRRLVAPLIERVYLDIDSRRIGAITPTPEFKALIDHALEPTADPEVALIPPESAEDVSSWRSWRWRSGDITADDGVDLNLDENADLVNSWRWWRRGRIELPVQRASVTDLLRV